MVRRPTPHERVATPSRQVTDAVRRGRLLQGEENANRSQGVSMSTTPPVQVRSGGKAGVSYGALAKIIVIAVVALAILIFVLQNTASVEWTFLFWSFSVNQWIMLVVSLVVGFLVGMAVSAVLRRRRKDSQRHKTA
jgi:uncharacterized integral membrane protein